MYVFAYDELLAKYIREHDAYKAEYSKKIEAFKAVRASFIKEIPSRVFSTREIPGTKSVQDCYHRLEKKRREPVCDGEPLSGNVETATDIDMLLDDPILEKDKFGENTRAERDKQHVREQQ